MRTPRHLAVVPSDIIVAGDIMVRTVISLDERDKQWLDRKAREQRVPMTTLVRRAIRDLRLRRGATVSGEPAFDEILRLTKGTWTKGDAARWVKTMRSE